MLRADIFIKKVKFEFLQLNLTKPFSSSQPAFGGCELLSF